MNSEWEQESSHIYFYCSLCPLPHRQRELWLLGEQQDKAWNKINGDKDVPLVQGMLKSAGFKSVTQLFIKIAKDRTEKQVQVSFLFKI